MWKGLWVGCGVLGRSGHSMDLSPCLELRGVKGGSTEALLRTVQGLFQGVFQRELCLGCERPRLLLSQRGPLRPSLCKMDRVGPACSPAPHRLGDPVSFLGTLL